MSTTVEAGQSLNPGYTGLDQGRSARKLANALPWRRACGKIVQKFLNDVCRGIRRRPCRLKARPEMKTLSYSHLLADWLCQEGYTHCFFVAGGGCMHLLEGFRGRLQLVPVVHEVSAGIAAEHFNETSRNGRALALVTTGPGFTNILTAIAGCHTQRRQLLVIAGQVKTTDLLHGGLRQRGIQEVDGSSVAAPICVAATCLRQPMGRADFLHLVRATTQPHPGPVVIEICLDVQGAKVERELLEQAPAGPSLRLLRPEPTLSEARLDEEVALLTEALQGARRPLIIIGGLVSRNAMRQSLAALERAGVALMTATCAIDRVPDCCRVYAGRPGTWGGQRSANLLVAQADVVLGIGLAWDLQQTGFNVEGYAPNARLFQVYPCPAELSKGHLPLERGICAQPDAFLLRLAGQLQPCKTGPWLEQIQLTRRLLPVLEPANRVREGYVQAFELMHHLSVASKADDVFALSSSGGSFTGSLQVCRIKPGQLATTSPAFASMGYALATAIGAALANPGARVIHIEGDGGFCQNLQELAIVALRRLPIKMFILDNRGYGSIRATQRKFFGGAYVGCDEDTGLGFPDWIGLFAAFGIPASRLTPEQIEPSSLAAMLDQTDGPQAWIASLDPEAPNFPAVSTSLLPDGRMQSDPLWRQLPPVAPEVLQQVGLHLPTPP